MPWLGAGDALTCIQSRRGNELVQLAPQEVPLLLQVLNALLQPGVSLQGQVQLGPDAGKYYTSFCIPGRTEILREMVNRGHPVYVKD